MVGSEAKVRRGDTEGVRLKAWRVGKVKGTRFALGSHGEGYGRVRQNTGDSWTLDSRLKIRVRHG